MARLSQASLILFFAAKALGGSGYVSVPVKAREVRSTPLQGRAVPGTGSTGLANYKSAGYTVDSKMPSPREECTAG